MAEEHRKSEEEIFVDPSDGIKRRTWRRMKRTTDVVKEDTTTSIKSSICFNLFNRVNFSNCFTSFIAKEELSSTSTCKVESIDCASLASDPAPSPCSDYFITRIQSIIEGRSKFGTNLESEIGESKEHWSEMWSEDDEEGFSGEKILEVFRSLQKQYGGPEGFFMDWNDKAIALGEKIAEGARGETLTLTFLHNLVLDQLVLKVFKKELCLQDLQKQWPQGMLHKAHTSENSCCINYKVSPGIRGQLYIRRNLRSK